MHGVMGVTAQVNRSLHRSTGITAQGDPGRPVSLHRSNGVNAQGNGCHCTGKPESVHRLTDITAQGDPGRRSVTAQVEWCR